MAYQLLPAGLLPLLLVLALVRRDDRSLGNGECAGIAPSRADAGACVRRTRIQPAH